MNGSSKFICPFELQILADECDQYEDQCVISQGSCPTDQIFLIVKNIVIVIIKSNAKGRPTQGLQRLWRLSHWYFKNNPGKTIGEGTFGKVKEAIHKSTNQQVAIKILEKSKITEVADVERVSREIHILKLIRHPNIVQLYEIIETPKQLFLVMEFMESGELFDYIVQNKRIQEAEAARMFH